jgi:16S rRNA (cytidine1402-2'-O)-methyltransferase
VEKGILYLVATPIGNLKDITYRAIETLNSVDIILSEDTRKTLKLLNHFEIKKQLLSFYRHNEEDKLDYVIDLLNQGKNLALVSDAGTPAISDPGEILVREAIENNIKVIPIPGPTALISGLIASGFDTTRFVFEGFLPINKKLRSQRLEALINETRTTILYEAPHKLKGTLEDLYKSLGNRNIVLARELTKIYEEFIRTTIEEAIEYYKEKEIKGEFVILIQGAILSDEPVIKEESIELLMKEYQKKGYDKKEAMKLVAKDKGLRKTDVYKYLLEQ